MSEMKQIGTWPTPYGVEVPVYEPIDPNDPESFTFKLDAMAITCGIHDPKERERFIEDTHRRGSFNPDWLDEYGGHRAPRIPLPRPADPIYPALPRDCHEDIPIEGWITSVMDHHRWCDRAAALMDILAANMAGRDSQDVPPEIVGLGLCHVLTAALEHLTEPEINCLEAAAFYAITLHDDWSDAGVEWLEPFKATWFRDWVDARPAYRQFAGLCRLTNLDLPLWLEGGDA